VKRNLFEDESTPSAEDLTRKHKRNVRIAAGMGAAAFIGGAELADYALAATKPVATVAYVNKQPAALPDTLKGIELPTLSLNVKADEASSNKPESATKHHLGRWNSKLHRYVIYDDANNYPEQAKDQATVKFTHIWDGAIFLKMPKHELPQYLTVMKSPSAYYSPANLGEGNLDMDVAYNRYSKGEKAKGATSTDFVLVCTRPVIGWGHNNPEKYAGVQVQDDYGNAATGYIDLTMAEKAGAVEYYKSGGGWKSALQIKKPMTGKLQPLKPGEYYGHCLYLDRNDVHSWSSHKKIARYVKRWYDMHPAAHKPHPPHS